MADPSEAQKRIEAGRRWGRAMKRFCSEIPAVEEPMETFVRELSNERKRRCLERFRETNLKLSAWIEILEREVDAEGGQA